MFFVIKSLLQSTFFFSFNYFLVINIQRCMYASFHMYNYISSALCADYVNVRLSHDFPSHKRTRIFLLELLNIPYFQWWNKRTEPGFKTPDLPWPLLIPSSIWYPGKPHYVLPVKIIHDRQQSACVNIPWSANELKPRGSF